MRDSRASYLFRLVAALAAAAFPVARIAKASARIDAPSDRRRAAALRAVTGMAERAAAGERSRMPAIETPREIARPAHAVDRLAPLFNRIREPRPVGGAHAR